MANDADRIGDPVTSTTVLCGCKRISVSSLRGNRFIKAAFLVFLIVCLYAWSSNWSHSGVSSRCPFRQKGIPFLMRPASRCDEGAPFLVLLVTSSPGQFEARSVIRQTWGSERWVGGARAVTYFVLGHGRRQQDWIQREGDMHRDIIQGDFDDTYYNLTLKVLVGLEWLCCYCPSAAFVMKTDSDMFVNTDYLLELLSRAPRSSFATGAIFRNFKPTRVKWSRWYISKEEYPGATYPPFCSGTGYVMSTDVACGVWNLSGTAPMFKLEDVYVGLRLAELKVNPVPIHSKPVFFYHKVPYSASTYRRLVTSHHITNSEKLLYWRGVQDSDSKE
ncbi:beta-1,3-galactosyltransferase 5-like [Hypanus sabinus]|uniref:beta-1,3-galactosyltransferase 5-like n=1 Tax=Hypanus sabinus TaxID=79690 RepID=UPI0028C38779|nr:beta-1,3-galactosyltransferase 5-like [Hypanus sabinus]